MCRAATSGALSGKPAPLSHEMSRSGGVLHRLERTMGEPGTRASQAADRPAGRAARDLRAPVLHVSLGARGRSRAPDRALRADGRRLSFVAAWLQLFRRRVGRLHRSVRHRSADRCRHGDLSRGSCRAEATGAWRHTDESGTQGGRDGGRVAPSTAEGDDGRHRHRRTAADHVEHAHRRRGDEAARDTGARRHGVVAAPCAGRHSGDLLLDSRAAPGTSARTRPRDEQYAAVPGVWRLPRKYSPWLR